jgi:hypothetical protein
MGGTIMKPAEILSDLLRGKIMLVGEYRGSRAEITGYVDHKTGDKIQYVRAIHLAECECRGNLDRAIIFERLSDAVETPEEAMFEHIRGKKYVFYLESVKWDRGQVTGFMAEGRRPQLVEQDAEEGAGALAEPSGPARGPVS